MYVAARRRCMDAALEWRSRFLGDIHRATYITHTRCERFIFIDMYGLHPVIDSFDGSFAVIGITYLLHCTFSITNTHYTMWSHHRQSRSALTHFFSSVEHKVTRISLFDCEMDPDTFLTELGPLFVTCGESSHCITEGVFDNNVFTYQCSSDIVFSVGLLWAIPRGKT